LPLAPDAQVLRLLPSLFWVGGVQERVMAFALGAEVAVKEPDEEEALDEVRDELAAEDEGAALEAPLLALGVWEFELLGLWQALRPALRSRAASA
jgi:hypothetical protein